MEKIIEDWRRYLNEFKMDDKFQDIDDVVDTNIDPQTAIQAEIDKQMKFNIGGRPINPAFLSKSLDEQTIKEFLEDSSDYAEGEEILDRLVDMPVSMMLSPDFETLGQIESGQKVDIQTLRRMMNRTADYVELYNEIVHAANNNIEVLKDFYRWFVNSDYLKIIKALALYTGHNVESIRDPSKFDNSKRIKSIFEKDFFMIKTDTNYSTKSSFDARSLSRNYRKLTNWLLPTYKRDFSNDRRVLESIASMKNYKAFVQSNFLPDSPIGSELEKFRNSDEFRKRYNFYMTFITKWKPILDKLSNFSEIKPSQVDYRVSKKIIGALCNAPDSSGQDIFRGMSLDINVIAELINVHPLKLEEFMDAGEIKEFGTENQFIFDFGVVSSCSSDYDVAYDFALPFSMRGDPSRHGIMFRFVPKRGVEIGSYSIYPEEEEFITSGRIKINKVVLRPGRPHSIFDFYCEQV